MTAKYDSASNGEYEWVHGHKPRGEGHWIFDLGRRGAWTTTSHYGTFTEAKKQAMTVARQLGCDTVRVCT